MIVLGFHLMLDLKGCDREKLNDLAYIRQSMLEAVQQLGAKLLGETFHKFSPYGVTGVVSIAESHLTIHTWPEHKYAAVDIFTCSSSLKTRRVAEYIIDQLECTEPSMTETQRGILSKPTPGH